MALYVSTVDYTGDGSTDMQVSIDSSGLFPQVLACFIVRETPSTKNICYKFWDFANDSFKDPSNTALLNSGQGINSMGVGTINVGKSAGASFTNHADENYAATCIGSDTGEEFNQGEYSGNSTNPRTITVGFQPDWIYVQRLDGNSAGRYWTVEVGGDNAAFFWQYTGTFNSGIITGVTSTGFTLTDHGDVNATGVDYAWIAAKKTSNSVDVGSYSGDGTTGRLISYNSHITLLPTLAEDNTSIRGRGLARVMFCKREETFPGGQMLAPENHTVPDGVSYNDGNTEFTDGISDFGNTTFQVEDHQYVNDGGGDTYHWVMFQGTLLPGGDPVPIGRPRLPFGYFGDPYSLFKGSIAVKEALTKVRIV